MAVFKSIAATQLLTRKKKKTAAKKTSRISDTRRKSIKKILSGKK
jgi:hypothetical protein